MIKNLKKSRALWLFIGCLSLIAALIGVFYADIYSNVVSQDLLPGTISQDAITVIAGLVLVFLSLRTSEGDVKKQIVALSLLAYLFYGYGIYVIEQLYNSLYLLYMAIFALSFWSIVYGLVNINQDVLRQFQTSKWVRYLSAGSSIFIPLLFYSLWISQLVPLMQTGEKIEYFYSIYILDMTFVLPAFVITAVLMIKKNAFGLLFAPILFIKAFTLLFSVGLGGFVGPLYDQATDPGRARFILFCPYSFWLLLFLISGSFGFRNRTDHDDPSPRLGCWTGS